MKETELPKLSGDLHKEANIFVVKSYGKYRTLKQFVELAVKEKIEMERGLQRK